MRVCRFCNKTQQLSAFYRRTDGTNLYRTECKKCLSEKAAQFYLKNHDRKIKYARHYYYAKCNTFEYKKRRLAWLIANPESIKMYRKKYAQSEKGKAAAKRGHEKWCIKNKQKIQAHTALNHAIIQKKSLNQLIALGVGPQT